MEHIDLERDTLVPVYEITKQRFGSRVAPATVWRWVRKGRRGVRLEAVFIHGKWHTTSAAFAAFLSARTTDTLAAEERPEGSDRSSALEARLRAAGLL